MRSCAVISGELRSRLTIVTRKVTVLLSDAEFHAFDRYCMANGFKKSTLIARLIRAHLEAMGPLTPDRGERREGVGPSSK
jgi:hypothetical protein